MSAPARDWDLRLPDVVLYAAPLALGLFCLLMSQANDVVFWGFEEDEPATLLSSLLIFSTLLIALAGVRRPDLPRPMRIVAGVMALLATVAVLDENLKWHEWLGRQVQREVSSLPKSLTWYTDDVIVLLGALVGGLVIYRCIVYASRACDTPRQRLELLPYLACVVVFAVAHGLLDIGGHSHYMVDRFWPGLSAAAADSYVERISYFEEICKLWTEWFAVLLLLKLLHRQRGPLAWSLAAAIGCGMAVLGGLWAASDPGRGVPCLTVGEPLDFIRNFHALFVLAWLWTAWAVIGWVCFRDRPRRIESTGLLFVLPVAPLIGGMVDPDGLGGAIAWLAGSLAHPAYYGASIARQGLFIAMLLGPAVAAGLAVGPLIRRWPLSTGLGLALAGGVLASWEGPSLERLAPAALTGGVVLFSQIRRRRQRPAILTAVLLALAALAASPWWAAAALTWVVFAWAADRPDERLRRWSGPLLALAGAQLALSLLLIVRNPPVFIPNYEWTPDHPVIFDVIDQPLENPSGRRE